MAALVESGLTQPRLRGRATRSGFFQMRVGHLEPGRRTPATPSGRSSSSTGSSTRPRRSSSSASRAGCRSTTRKQYGEWIADVERPAEQYRGRYQLRLSEARELLERVGGRSREPREPRPQAGDVIRMRIITPEEARRARGG